MQRPLPTVAGGHLPLKNVLLQPQFPRSLVSVSRFVRDTKGSVVLEEGKAEMRAANGEVLVVAKEENGLYVLPPLQKGDNTAHVLSIDAPSVVRDFAAAATAAFDEPAGFIAPASVVDRTAEHAKVSPPPSPALSRKEVKAIQRATVKATERRSRQRKDARLREQMAPKVRVTGTENCAVPESVTSVGEVSLQDVLLRGTIPDGFALLADAKVGDLHALHHARCGHQGPELMRAMGYPVRADFHCSTCALANARKQPTLKEKPEECRDPYRLHADTAGPLPLSRLGKQYFSIFVDEGTGYVVGRFMRQRGEQYEATLSALSEVKAVLGRFPSRFRSDNAKEYVSVRLQTALLSHSIFRENSAPYHSAGNGMAERMIGRVKSIARALLRQAGLSSSWWCEAVEYALYIINRTPSVEGKSPFEHATGTPPDLTQLRVFGSDCFVLIRPQPSGFADRSVRCIFMGMVRGSTTTFQCWDAANRRMLSSRDVVFDERSVVSSITHPAAGSAAPPVLPSAVPAAPVPVFAGPPVGAAPSAFPDPVLSPPLSPASLSEASDAAHPSPELVPAPASSLSRLSQPPAASAAPIPPPFPQRRSLVPSSSLSGLFTPSAPLPAPAAPAAPGSVGGSAGADEAAALSSVVDKVLSSLDPLARNRHGETLLEEIALSDLLLAADDRELPASASAAWAHPVWRLAMRKEYDALISNGTWTLETLPQNRKVIKGKWVFRVKVNGSAKARYVVKGFTQKHGVDFDETYAPTAQRTSFKALVALAVADGLVLEQLDAASAFLKGDLQEELFVEQPAFFTLPSPSGERLVCRLRKPLYGLKQSPRCWHTKLVSTLKSLGFQQLRSDSCVFRLQVGSSVLYALSHVDDLAIAHNDHILSNRIKSQLRSSLEFATASTLEYFNGVQVSSDGTGGYYLHQTRFAQEIVREFDEQLQSLRKTPMDPRTAPVPRRPDESLCAVGVHRYQAAVGSLLYLLATRPDVQYSIGVAARFMSSPSSAHWELVQAIFRYISTTVNYGLHYPAGTGSALSVFSDADWAGDKSDRKSTSGFAVFIGGCLVSSSSAKQDAVSLSTCEAEFIAAARSCQELIWLRQFLAELTATPRAMGVPFFVDNKSAIDFSQNPIINSRSKHIDIKFYYLRDHVSDGVLDLFYCPTAEMVADVMTKPLPTTQFLDARRALGVKQVALVSGRQGGVG
jgi:transposase InsO family protein